MKATQTPIGSIKPHPNNPRIIKDGKFELLKKSLTDFPEMMETRPIVVNLENFILGGNMRYRAALDLGFKLLPCVKVDWTEERQREFIIKDNSGFGTWDFDLLANEWDAEELKEWGIDIPNFDPVDLGDFFKEGEPKVEKTKFAFSLEYSESDFNTLVEAFAKHSGTREEIIYKLLTA